MAATGASAPLLGEDSEAARASMTASEFTEGSSEDGSEYETATDSSEEESSEEEAPPPPPPPAKKPGFLPPGAAQRTFTLTVGMSVAFYVGVWVACGKPDWPRGLLCGENGVTCTGRTGSDGEIVKGDAFCQDNVFYNSTCFNNVCVDGSVDMHPLCWGTCTPVNIMTVWDMLGANIALIIYWVAGEFLLVAFSKELGAELKEGFDYQAELNKKEGFDPKAHAKAVKHSWQWNEELNGWLERRAQQKGLFGRGVKYRAYGFYLFYTVLLGAITFLLIKKVSPQQLQPPKYAPGSVDAVMELAGSFFKPQLTGMYTWLIVIQFFLEVGLFFAAALTVRWPRPALVRSGRLKYRPNVNFLKNATDAVNLMDEHPGLIQDTCLLIACHESTLTKDRTKTFSHTLDSALKLFPANAVFVCDNGRTEAPVDRTQQVCEDVSKSNDQYADVRQQIQYLFIPEGNKTHAMYWTTEYWIPELVRRGECEDFGYAMIIDDDVPLPPDLHVPLQTLARNVEIKAVSYVIMAASEDGRERQLVNFQDAEYKLAGFVKQFQWNYGSTLACHGAIGLWRRDVLGKKILWDHDTMFHGEDMYMGLLLHRMQKNYTIMVSAGAVVPTFAPETMLILFRQRVTSWDLCAQRKFSTYVREFLSSPLNTRTLILKPFLLQEIINVVLDWVRIYLMIGLGHRNMPCLILCFAIFYMLLYVEIYVFNYTVLRDRHDLRMSGRTVLLFPFYRTFSLSFRLYALLKNVLQYSTWTRKNLAISVRESEIHDMPPVPPVAHPDWWSIWQPNEDTAKDDKLRSFTKALCADVVLEAPQDKQRLQSLATAYLIFQKLLHENSACSFPRLLARGGNDSRGPREIARALGALRELFDNKMEEIVGAAAWPGFERRLDATLQQWAGTSTMLFFVPQLANTEFDNRDFVVRSNLHVVGEITELVFATRWPKNHDKVADIKESLAQLKDMLQVQLDKIQAAGQSEELETQQRLRKMVTVLEWVKQVIEDNSAEQLEDARRELQEVQTQAQSLGADGEVVLTVVANLSRRLATMGDGSSGAAGGAPSGAATAMSPVV